MNSVPDVPKVKNGRCERCHGVRGGGLADDYFIRKCWCLEVAEEEQDYDEDH